MSRPRFFDVHTHVQFHAFQEDADLVIQRALDAGVWMINVGTQQDTSANAIALAQKFSEGIYATVGLHPIHTEKSYHDPQELGAPSVFSNSRELENTQSVGFMSRGEEFDYESYKKLAADAKVVAIGECGLDYYRLGPETKAKQEQAFIQQVELAHEIQKPLMIHCRNAFPDLISILVSHRMSLLTRPGVIHFFSGSKDDASSLLDLGFYFSFGGVITFVRDYDKVLRYIPLDRILLETDAPYVAPVPYRGKRNEPSYVIEVAKKVAELKSATLEEIGSITTANALKVFELGQQPPG